jgi:Flp pilus assembly protein CpaB
MTYRLRNIVVAVALALMAALLTTFYVANYKRHVRQSESTVRVFVAKRDVPQGTPGVELAKHGFVTTQDVAQRAVVPGAISSPDEVQNLLTSQAIFAGEQITLRRFSSHAEEGIRAQLHGTLRAISLPGTSDQLLAGILKAGDHVDLIANLKTGSGSASFATRNIARELLVLHAPDAAPRAPSSTTSSVILAVSDKREAQKVFFAVQNSAGWALQLRPVANATDSPEDVESTESMVNDGVTPANLGRAGVSR